MKTTRRRKSKKAQLREDRPREVHVYSSCRWEGRQKQFPWAVQKEQWTEHLWECYRKKHWYEFECCCFTGDGYVTLSGGAKKLVSEVKAGDVLESAGSHPTSVTVDCVTQETVSTILFNVDGVWLTHNHPVLHKNKWIFPRDGNFPTKLFEGEVFNFLLDDPTQSFCVNGVAVVGFQNDKSPVPHKFYTTDHARRFLEAHPQFPHVRLTKEDAKTIDRITSGL